jgi:hypothetical protein
VIIRLILALTAILALSDAYSSDKVLECAKLIMGKPCGAETQGFTKKLTITPEQAIDYCECFIAAGTTKEAIYWCIPIARACDHGAI